MTKYSEPPVWPGDPSLLQALIRHVADHTDFTEGEAGEAIIDALEAFGLMIVRKNADKPTVPPDALRATLTAPVRAEVEVARCWAEKGWLVEVYFAGHGSEAQARRLADLLRKAIGQGDDDAGE